MTDRLTLTRAFENILARQAQAGRRSFSHSIFLSHNIRKDGDLHERSTN